jgi:uncharacterized RDD family membrane protein YckC
MNYHVARNGQHLGVFADHDIGQKLATGELSGGDLAWAEGMAEWQPISVISGLAGGAVPVPVPSVNPYNPPRAFIRQPINRKTAELASLWDRFAASTVDGLIFGLGGKLLGLAFESIDLGCLYWLALCIYNLVRLTSHGQTIGKKWVGIRIAKIEDDSNPGFVKAFLLRSLVNGIISVIPFYLLIDIGFIFRENRRCIHDLIAGTHVVKC